MNGNETTNVVSTEINGGNEGKPVTLAPAKSTKGGNKKAVKVVKAKAPAKGKNGKTVLPPESSQSSGEAGGRSGTTKVTGERRKQVARTYRKPMDSDGMEDYCFIVGQGYGVILPGTIMIQPGRSNGRAVNNHAETR